jgi:hypothetical protein
MSKKHRPVPQEHNDLVPPSKRPPTAVGAATPPLPPREPRRHRSNWPTDLTEHIRATLSKIFDVADGVADTIKRELKRLEARGEG